MNKILLFLVYVILSQNISFAQDELAIGQWRSHLPYHRFQQLTQSPSKVFAATDWSIVSIDKDDFSVEFISKIDGLSSTGMGVIGHSQTADVLVLTYTNSEFDIIKNGDIKSFSDISTDGNFTDRTINAIHFDNTDDLYFGTAFGLVKFDLESEEFLYTVDMGFPVYDLVVLDNNIYAATEDGIYTISNAASVNQQDFNNWRLLDQGDGFPLSYSCEAIEVKGEEIYLGLNDSLMIWKDNQLEYLTSEENHRLGFITSEDNGVLIGFNCEPSCQGKTIYYDPLTQLLTEAGSSCVFSPKDALEDEEGKIWYADGGSGIRIAKSSGASCAQKLDFNSPATHNSSEILIHKNKVYIAGGGVLPNGSFAGRQDGVFYYNEDKNWLNYDRWSVPLFYEKDAFIDFYRLAVNPVNDKAYYGTYWGGLIEQDGESFTVYNETNSSLRGAEGDVLRERVGGLAFDSEQNLWISNNSATMPLSVFKNDGTWKSFSVSSFKNISQLVIDGLGYKWMIIDGTGQGILVYDDSGTIDDTSDDRQRIITSNNSLLPDNDVLSLAVDLDGDVWVGTSNGVIVFECGSLVFNEEDCQGSRRVVEENDFDDENEYLLKGEAVTTIAIDPANRKWFGTTNGIFVQNANGDKQVARFEESNSPLFDDIIIDIAINNENGEVFIGTNKGVISYKGEAIDGTSVNTVAAYAFPNPVRPEYTGPIAIKGLAENANVKITDVNGGLIFETQALGGQAIWDGKDYNGRRASTGVYLVFSTSNNINNPDAIVTKILVVN